MVTMQLRMDGMVNSDHAVLLEDRDHHGKIRARKEDVKETRIQEEVEMIEEEVGKIQKEVGMIEEGEGKI